MDDINLFGLKGYGEKRRYWAHPFRARLTAIERGIERAEADCNELRAACLRHAYARVNSVARIYDAVTEV